jgi:hypothetical protein
MKQILLHQASIDNAGRYRDAGATLTIAESSDPDTITAVRADALLDMQGAVIVSTATRDPIDHHADGAEGDTVMPA